MKKHDKVTDRFTGGLALGCRAGSAKGSDWHSRSFAFKPAFSIHSRRGCLRTARFFPRLGPHLGFFPFIQRERNLAIFLASVTPSSEAQMTTSSPFLQS